MFQLGGKLLRALEEHRVPRHDENVKGIGWFLVCIGESLEKGSLLSARRLRNLQPGQTPVSSTPSIGIGFCLLGDQIMDWAAGIYHQEKS